MDYISLASKLLILKNYFYTLGILLLYFSINAQVAHTTISGQKVLVYSDGSWEYNYEIDNSKTSPFEVPTQTTGDAHNKVKYKKLKQYLQKIEIEQLINLLLADNSTDSLKSNNYYISTGEDILLLESSLNDNTKYEIITDRLSNKYFPIASRQLKPITYQVPKVTGKTIQVLSNDILFDGPEPNSGIQIKQTTKTDLLTYTPKKLLNYYKDKVYLVIKNSAVKREGEYYLTFDLIFSSKDIKKGYGTIPTDGFVRINLINGKSVFLQVTKTVEARIEKYTGKTIYPLICRIKNKDDMRTLSKQYVDDIGVMWSTGFENYPIYDVAYFIQKFKSLNGSK